ncbi:MAG: putative toxin-antitoxin system toxin component, PIN family [Chloroflexi bacterium]|nr:putative toxin-antitoxin system toxin component, PIN family [Chloroflexota bacterium]
MPPLRLVLDTNVLLSALLFPDGGLSWLRETWQSGAILPLVSRDTTSELIRVLLYPKFRLNEDEREDLLADYLPWCETVTVSGSLAVPDCRDPFDRPFLELALSGRADALVTGDGDLLALAPVFSVPILTPNALKKHLENCGTVT